MNKTDLLQLISKAKTLQKQQMQLLEMHSLKKNLRARYENKLKTNH